MKETAASKSQWILLLAYGGRVVLNLAITILVGRALPPGEFGFFSFIATLFTSGNILLDLGTVPLSVREISREPARERPLLESLMAWRSLLGLVLSLVILGIAIEEQDLARKLVLLGTAALMPLLSPGALYPAFQVRQRIKGPAWLGVVGVMLVLVLVIILTQLGVVGAPLSWMLVAREGFVAAVFLVMANRLLGYVPKPGFRGRQFRPFLALAAVNAVAVALHTLYFYEDVFLVRWMRGDAELGAYASAFRLFNPFFALPATLMLPMLPVLTESARKDRKAFRARALKSARQLGTLGVVGGILALVLGVSVMESLYGGRYTTSPLDASPALMWLSLAFAAAFIAPTFTMGILADGGERTLIRLGALGVLVNLTGNLLLIPRHGFVGAAATTALTEVVVSVASGISFLKRASR